ncbi:hypothetical protein BUALT_Bualt03G0163000 [Buddleja alternifolia]|uniref:EIF3F/CSN6-like C-terminal domain-containing protein n=1 Tax=Buddleja alternifolia TaxID=168488 RepID=A0AAV6XV89_9LAMI|nr:hypothetical protein BUALT_Bualt03G0163000 [Buddleja alternifolia]
MKRQKDAGLHAIREETVHTLDSENSSGEEGLDGQRIDEREWMELRQLRNAMRESRKTASYEDDMHNRHGYGHPGAGSSQGPTSSVKRGISHSFSVREGGSMSSREPPEEDDEAIAIAPSRPSEGPSRNSRGKNIELENSSDDSDDSNSGGNKNDHQQNRGCLGYGYGYSNDNYESLHSQFDGASYGFSYGSTGYHGYDYSSSGNIDHQRYNDDLSSGASGAGYHSHDYGSFDSVGSSGGYHGFGYHLYQDESLSRAHPFNTATYSASNQQSRSQGEQNRSDIDDFVLPLPSSDGADTSFSSPPTPPRVEIFNSFELLYDDSTHLLDRAFLEKKQDLCLMDINESPVYVLLNPSNNPAQKDLPITIYESGMYLLILETERISVDHVVHLKPSDGGSAATQLAAHLTGTHSAIKMLNSRIRVLHHYLLAMRRDLPVIFLPFYPDGLY